MVDYSIYLVTDSTMVPESSTFLRQVEDSLRGGATLIQLREKNLLTLEFIERAEKVHALTKKFSVPLIINDRVDVALAIDAEGVHVGQDDMPARTVRKLIGATKILGVTCSNPEEVSAVCKDNVADYVGLGTVYQTNTKKDVDNPDGCGPIGIRKMLQVLGQHNTGRASTIKCVAIGGVNHSNAAKVLYQCRYRDQALDGLAIVSCIMANNDAFAATKDFQKCINTKPPWLNMEKTSAPCVTFDSVRGDSPMVHHITNNVVKNFSANVTLSIGASPIMSELAAEFEEFAANVANLSLVLNLGTPDTKFLDIARHAISVYNKHGKPILFDPVAAGASRERLQSCERILNAGHITVIKGNLGEILAIYKLTAEYKGDSSNEKELMRGVDSIVDCDSVEIIKIGQTISENFQCTVVITGKTNYIVDGKRNKTYPGGDKLMGSITGTGCSLGSTIAAFLATTTAKYNQFEAITTAVKLYNEAGQQAATNSVSPGTFMIKFLDSLYELSN